MNLKTKVEKMEQESGINEPCEVCAFGIEWTALVHAFASRVGVAMPEPQPHEIIPSRCAWCYRFQTTDISHMSDDERETYQRYFAALEAGTFCLPKNATLWEEFKEACFNSERRIFGQHYEEFRGLVAELREGMSRITGRLTPRFHYLCRVDGCRCDYPKTEKEWQANHSEWLSQAA